MSTSAPHTLDLQPTPIRARGISGTWLTGMALVICVAMILGLLALIAIGGSRTFWQKPVERITLDTGETFLGLRIRAEESPESGPRILYRVGNRDLGQQPFRWVSKAAVTQYQTPPHAVLVERDEWGIWLGEPARLIEANIDGTSTTIAEGPEELLRSWPEAAKAAAMRRAEIDRVRRHDITVLNQELEALRVDDLEAKLRANPTTGSDRLSYPLWFAVAGATALAGIGIWRVPSPLLRRLMIVALSIGLVALFVGRPWADRPLSPEQLTQRLAQNESKRSELTQQFTELTQRVAQL